MLLFIDDSDIIGGGGCRYDKSIETSFHLNFTIGTYALPIGTISVTSGHLFNTIIKELKKISFEIACGPIHNL